MELGIGNVSGISTYFKNISKFSHSPTLGFGGEKVGHKPGSVLSTASSFRGQLSIWDACYQTPQAVPKNGTGKKPTIVPPTLLPTGVYLASTSQCCWCALTAPLHPYPYQFETFDAISSFKLGGGIFLWHYPHDRSHWALPSKFGFSGARTFLRPAFANPQPPAPTFSPDLLYAIARYFSESSFTVEKFSNQPRRQKK